MDVIGWSLLTLPDDRDFRPDAGTEEYAVPSSWLNITRSPQNCADQPESESATYTSLSEVDRRLNFSVESLNDWERLSDSDQCDGEQHCQSLPDCGNHGNRLLRSNTVWYAPLDRNVENKDFTFKNKFISAWTNVTNGWVLKTATSFKIDSQICLLGRKYTCDTQSPAESRKVKFAEFKEDFASRIWLTYRMDFSMLPRSQLSSDVGWGCMLRSGQMMLAQAFILHFINRNSMLSSDDASQPQHRKIIRYFGDVFSDDCPFSIHKLVEISHSLGRQTGDWFGPASICVVLRDALDQAKSISTGHIELSQLVIYLTMDCTVYKQDVVDLCTGTGTSTLEQCGTGCPELLSAEASSSADDRWQSLIILMPLRLGSETLNAIYIPCIKKILESDLCIGIIGGRPKHSLYFVGWQDDRLIHLDPHCCQKTVNVLDDGFPTETFHCAFPRKLPFMKMDPTCAIGFYCKTRQDFERLVKDIPQMIAQPLLENSPLFSFQEGRRADVEKGCLCSMDTFRQMKGDHT